MRAVPFHNIQSAEVHVDAAVGLPALFICARASIKVIEAGSMKIVSASNPYSFSRVDSEARAPKFDLFLSFPELIQEKDAIVLVRIDALENRSMSAKCAGYAWLNLYVDKTSGKRPERDASDDSVCLNSGVFLLPLFTGTYLPTYDTYDRK